MFKAGERLLEIMQDQGWENKDLSPILKRSVSMIGNYLKMDTFSPPVLKRLHPLKKFGYNIPDYFEYESAPMKIENKEVEKDAQIEILTELKSVIEELNKEVKRNNDLNEKLYQLLKQNRK